MADHKTGDSEKIGKIEGHHYDGIEELDHALPNWWVNLFYLTIIFSLLYFAYYSIGEGPSLVKEYRRDQEQIALASASRASQIKVASEEELRAMLKDSNKLKIGQEIFKVRCVSCHGANAEGVIGPNLTDGYWIHGGKMTEIAHTITTGVVDKGMPLWGSILSQEEIHSLTVYIKSLRGSNPSRGKAPQGTLEKE